MQDPTPLDDAVRARWEAENRQLALLFGQARAGSIPAFDDLYQRTARWLLSQVRRWVDEASAEDVLTEVYLHVWRNLSSYDAQRSSPAVWLAVIARSRALDHLRREQRHRAEPLDVDLLDRLEGVATAEPERVAIQAQQRSLVERVLAGARLSAPERMVVGLAYYGERTQQEIAGITHLPLGTVKSLMVRAQGKLRQEWTLRGDADLRDRL